MITDILKLFTGDLLKEIIPDSDLRSKIEAEVKKNEHDYDVKRIEGMYKVAVEQAKHKSLFVAGARPAGMWLVHGLTAIAGLSVIVSEFRYAEGYSVNEPSGVLMTLFWACLSIEAGFYGFRSLDHFTGKSKSSLK